MYSAWQSCGRNRHVRTAPSNSPSVSSAGAGCFRRSRGKPQMVGALLAPVSITLFAQGDPRTTRPRPRPLPSTPVRTGGPALPFLTRSRLSFDPCSHRETEANVRLIESGYLRPLFAQGDPWESRRKTASYPSTPVRTGRPSLFLHNIFVTGNPAFMRLLRPHFSGLTSILS